MTTKYEYCDSGSAIITGLDAYGASRWRAQQIVPQVVHTVTSIKGRFYRNSGGTPGTFSLGVYATDSNGHPTGSALTEGTYDGNTIQESPNNDTWYEITMTEYTLLTSVMYGIVLKVPSGDSSNYVAWVGLTSTAYTDGMCVYTTDGGSTWYDTSTRDHAFEVYGNKIGSPLLSGYAKAFDGRATKKAADPIWTYFGETWGSAYSQARRIVK